MVCMRYIQYILMYTLKSKFPDSVHVMKEPGRGKAKLVLNTHSSQLVAARYSTGEIWSEVRWSTERSALAERQAMAPS